jgi:hypothetical protein
MGMRVISFDGLSFEVNLPAIAVNAQDVAGVNDVVIESTLEPAVIANSTVLIAAKVYLAPKNNAEDAQCT